MYCELFDSFLILEIYCNINTVQQWFSNFFTRRLYIIGLDISSGISAVMITVLLVFEQNWHCWYFTLIKYFVIFIRFCFLMKNSVKYFNLHLDSFLEFLAFQLSFNYFFISSHETLEGAVCLYMQSASSHIIYYMEPAYWRLLILQPLLAQHFGLVLL